MFTIYETDTHYNYMKTMLWFEHVVLSGHRMDWRSSVGDVQPVRYFHKQLL